MEYVISARHCVECFTNIISFNPYSHPRRQVPLFSFLDLRKLKLREVKYLSTYKHQQKNSRLALPTFKFCNLNSPILLFCVGVIGDVDAIKDCDQKAGGHREKQDEAPRSS